MSNKSEFTSIFVGFQKLVENQYNHKIKALQTDGGREFINNQLKQHLNEHGIRHRISCPYTPQQYGIAERKHRHIIELGLSMMFQCHLPLKYWVEAFYTASYIGNLLPSATRDNKNLFQILQGKKPKYMHLRVFGSALAFCA